MRFRKVMTYFLAASFILGATFVASANRSRKSGIIRKKPRKSRSGGTMINERKLEIIDRESKKRFETMREENERGHEEFVVNPIPDDFKR